MKWEAGKRFASRLLLTFRIQLHASVLLSTWWRRRRSFRHSCWQQHFQIRRMSGWTSWNRVQLNRMRLCPCDLEHHIQGVKKADATSLSSVERRRRKKYFSHICSPSIIEQEEAGSISQIQWTTCCRNKQKDCWQGMEWSRCSLSLVVTQGKRRDEGKKANSRDWFLVLTDVPVLLIEFNLLDGYHEPDAGQPVSQQCEH